MTNLLIFMIGTTAPMKHEHREESEKMEVKIHCANQKILMVFILFHYQN